ncbi:hypothetical protein GM418_10840 [Maribellus comscasis]|uniref:Uncharacterized protein n=1 Tax=Maribellus comscasis TaxID=2681766 RepID=A0A6I6JMI7_9BACT|nr:hypothetical protein [Maribellus comscasis]QGY44136.1 hypothetical protein GM418_10840 [Maribellus comscasis]
MRIQVSGMRINTSCLSGGERKIVERLARKAGSSNLAPNEQKFLRDMSKRSSNY